MRKIDYAKLAHCFMAEKERILHSYFDNEKDRLAHIETLRKLMIRVSGSIGVDRTAFFKACGIDP